LLVGRPPPCGLEFLACQGDELAVVAFPEGLGGGGVAALEGRHPARHRAFRRHGIPPQAVCRRTGGARLHFRPPPGAAFFLAPHGPFSTHPRMELLVRRGRHTPRRAEPGAPRGAGPGPKTHPRLPVTEWRMSEKNPDADSPRK